MSMDTDQIEDRIQTSRHALGDTLDALGSKLSPGQMVDEVLGLARGQAGTFASNFGRQVRDNPMPALLIGAGMALIALQSRGDRIHHKVSAQDWANEARYRALEGARSKLTRQANETEDAFAHRLHEVHAQELDLKPQAEEALASFKERVSKHVTEMETSATRLRDRLSSAAGEVSAFTHQQTDALKTGASKMAHKGQELFEDSPLTIGAVALAVGAALGALAPLSSMEREGLDGVARKAASLGEAVVKQVKPKVEQAAAAFH